MLALNALRKRASFDPTLDRLGELQAEDESAKQDAYVKAETARLENRAIMRKEMAKREENAKRPNTGMPDPDWHPGIPGDMLSKEQNPWKTFYDNEALRGNYQALAGEGMPSPGGAHLMGSGGTIGSAGDAERANNAVQSAAALKSLQARASGGGGTSFAGGGGGGGEVTYSPGGNYSRGPALDDMGIERLKQAKLQTEMMEGLTPLGQAANRERLANERIFDVNTGRARHVLRNEAETEALAKTDKDIIEAQAYFHPDIYRAQEAKDASTAANIYATKVAPMEVKAAGDIEKARLGAEGRMREQEMRGNAAALLNMLNNITKTSTTMPLDPAHAATLAQMQEFLKAQLAGLQAPGQ